MRDGAYDSPHGPSYRDYEVGDIARIVSYAEQLLREGAALDMVRNDPEIFWLCAHIRGGNIYKLPKPEHWAANELEWVLNPRTERVMGRDDMVRHLHDAIGRVASFDQLPIMGSHLHAEMVDYVKLLGLHRLRFIYESFMRSIGEVP